MKMKEEEMEREKMKQIEALEAAGITLYQMINKII